MSTVCEPHAPRSVVYAALPLVVALTVSPEALRRLQRSALVVTIQADTLA